MTHTPECVQGQAQREAAAKAYRDAYPNHCPTCRGWGYFTSRGDMVPYGSTWVPLPDMREPCGECLGRGRCPRCGEESMVLEDEGDPGTEDGGPCYTCGWDQDKGEPEPWECSCDWEDVEVPDLSIDYEEAGREGESDG
jgi:hypothetical protein